MIDCGGCGDSIQPVIERSLAAILASRGQVSRWEHVDPRSDADCDAPAPEAGAQERALDAYDRVVAQYQDGDTDDALVDAAMHCWEVGCSPTQSTQVRQRANAQRAADGQRPVNLEVQWR